MGKKWPKNSAIIWRVPHQMKGSFTCHKSVTWDWRLYFPSEGRHAEEFFALKNPTALAGFEPTILGTRGQHGWWLPLHLWQMVTFPLNKWQMCQQNATACSHHNKGTQLYLLTGIPGRPSMPGTPGGPLSPWSPGMPEYPLSPAGPLVTKPGCPLGPGGPGRPWFPAVPGVPLLPSKPVKRLQVL
jgi:hypothetical protein